MPKLPKHILVIRLSAMGDVAMCVPVLRAFTRQFPNVKLSILTKAFHKPMFSSIKNVSLITADVKAKHKGLYGLWKLSRELKHLDIDAVADLHNVLRSNIIKFYLKSLPFEQIKKGRTEKKKLVSGENFIQLKTTHQRYLDVFNELGFEIDLAHPIFPSAEALHSETINTIGDYNKLIAIAPFAAFKGKIYPLSMMEQVIAQLEKLGKIVLFGGGQNEIDQLEEIALKFDNVINLAGKLSFEEELKVISNLKLMISMDSGNAHLAAMYGIETITIWGVTHPFAGFYPFNQSLENAVLVDRTQFPKIPTSVYGNKFPIGYEKAIASIAPTQIVDKATWLLNN